MEEIKTGDKFYVVFHWTDEDVYNDGLVFKSLREADDELNGFIEEYGNAYILQGTVVLTAIKSDEKLKT